MRLHTVPGFETEVFASHTFDSAACTSAARCLTWNAERQVFSGRVVAGMHTLVVRGPGLTGARQAVEVVPGTITQTRSAPWRAVEATLMFQSTNPTRPGVTENLGMRLAEVLEVDVLTPLGELQLEFTRKHARIVEGGFEFDARIPPSTLEIRAVTDLPRATKFYSPREGLRVLQPGDLDSSNGRPRLEIPLRRRPL